MGLRLFIFTAAATGWRVADGCPSSIQRSIYNHKLPVCTWTSSRVCGLLLLLHWQRGCNTRAVRSRSGFGRFVFLSSSTTTAAAAAAAPGWQ
uniref:Putative secreted protein n=1 Tax=Anopheles darlingi TaxID=43151 RepID=A0A2M4DN81_ANODA